MCMSVYVCVLGLSVGVYVCMAVGFIFQGQGLVGILPILYQIVRFSCKYSKLHSIIQPSNLYNIDNPLQINPNPGPFHKTTPNSTNPTPHLTTHHKKITQIKFQKYANYIQYIHQIDKQKNKKIQQSQHMAQQQVRQLKEKLENYQLEFQNYKVECKQLEAFLEEEAAKKEEEIRKLKEDAIRREKQLALNKNQLALLQSENNNLKQQIKLLDQLKSRTVSPPQPQPQPQKQLQLQQQLQLQKSESQQQQKKYQQKIQKLEKQNKEMELNHYQNQQRSTEEIMELKLLLQDKEKKIQALVVECQGYRNRDRERVGVQERLENVGDGFGVMTSRKKNGKIVQIKIEKTKTMAKDAQISEQEIAKLKDMLDQKDGQLKISNEKMSKLLTKIIAYEKRIKELQTYISSLSPSIDKNKANNNKSEQASGLKSSSDNLFLSPSNSIQKVSKKQIPSQSPGPSLSSPFQSFRHHLRKPTMSVLLQTKKHYTSPFVQIQSKECLKLYKQNKANKIDKTLGFHLYRCSKITYNMQQLVKATCDRVLNQIQNNFRESRDESGQEDRVEGRDIRQRKDFRIFVCGMKRTGKRIIFMSIFQQIKETLKMLSDHEESDGPVLRYAQIQGEIGQILIDIQASTTSDIDELIQKIKQDQSHSEYQNKPNTPCIRYLHLSTPSTTIQLISSSYLLAQPFPTSLNIALNKIIYQYIPKVNGQQRYAWQINHNTDLQIILTVNPILGYYEECKSTLNLLGCKIESSKKRVDVFDWRNSIEKGYGESPRKDGNRGVQEQVEGYRMGKMIDRVQFYQMKMKQLIVSLKTMISSSMQVSYLKKSQAALNYEKILRFVQAILNQGYIQQISPSKKNRSSINLQRLYASP